MNQTFKRPQVVMNMAMSADGKVSSISREPTSFTSREDKNFLVKLRSQCDALITAAGTVRIDRATMTVWDAHLRAERVRRRKPPHPIRVVVSGSLSIDPSLPVFKKPVSPLILVCCEIAPQSRRLKFSKLARVIVCGKNEVNIPKLISILAKEYGVRNILTEGGPTLNDAFFRARCVNELYVTLCPKLVGGQAAPTLVEGLGIPKLRQAVEAKLVSCRQGEEEWFLKYRF
jgi:riboflavin-specific deaminase-like protein